MNGVIRTPGNCWRRGVVTCMSMKVHPHAATSERVPMRLARMTGWGSTRSAVCRGMSASRSKVTMSAGFNVVAAAITAACTAGETRRTSASRSRVNASPSSQSASSKASCGHGGRRPCLPRIIDWVNSQRYSSGTSLTSTVRHMSDNAFPTC